MSLKGDLSVCLSVIHTRIGNAEAIIFQKMVVHLQGKRERPRVLHGNRKLSPFVAESYALWERHFVLATSS